jgi:hypothetical protein
MQGAGPDFTVSQHFCVLLVEDDAVTLRYVEQLLKKCGYSGVLGAQSE